MPKIIKPLTSKEVAAISKIGLTTLGGVAGQVRKMEVILRILLGDVFEDNGRIYLSNSKRPIERFA